MGTSGNNGNNGNNKTLVQEVVENMLLQPNDVGTRIGQHRVLLWFRPLENAPSYFMKLISVLSKSIDWEGFEPGTSPVVAVHSGSIYSFKEFVRQRTGIGEADAVVLGTSTLASLDQAMAAIDSMQLEHFIKYEHDEDAVAIAMHVLPLTGFLTSRTWIEPHQSSREFEPIDRRNQLKYGLEVKRPIDSIEGDLFAATLDEPQALKLLLKILSRKNGTRIQDTSSRSWDYLKHAQVIMSYGAVNEAGIVAVMALEELLIPLTGWSHEQVRRERLTLAKIISMVERHKRLHVSETVILREFSELRRKCSRAINETPPVIGSDQDLTEEVCALLEWLDAYPEWLR